MAGRVRSGRVDDELWGRALISIGAALGPARRGEPRTDGQVIRAALESLAYLSGAEVLAVWKAAERVPGWPAQRQAEGEG